VQDDIALVRGMLARVYRVRGALESVERVAIHTGTTWIWLVWQVGLICGLPSDMEISTYIEMVIWGCSISAE
jgi:hypothetical protein